MSFVQANAKGLGVNFELAGALELDKALAAVPGQLLLYRRRAVATLRRRLPVQARRDIQQEYQINAARARKDLSIRSTDTDLRLVGHFRGVGLRNFGARKTRKGVTAAIFRGRRSLFEGAFFAPLLGGNVQVVERQGEKREMRAGRYAGKKRQPIVTRYGPTLSQMLRKGRRPDRLADFARNLLRDEVLRQLKSDQGGSSA